MTAKSSTNGPVYIIAYHSSWYGYGTALRGPIFGELPPEKSLKISSALAVVGEGDPFLMRPAATRFEPRQQAVKRDAVFFRDCF